MTARPPEPLHDDPLSAEERDIAARLARLDAAVGPSAALDARILAAAQAAVAPRVRLRRARWTQGVGAAAVLVAAVGLAWQLKPMFALPPPLHSEHSGAGPGGAEADVVVQVESVPQRAPAPVADAGDAAARVPPPAAPRRAMPAPGGGPVVAARAKVAPPPAPAAAPALHAHDFPDEAVPPADAAVLDRVENVAAAAAAAPAPAAAPPPPVDITARKAAVTPQMREAAALPDVSADARLPLNAWFLRIRARRDAGDLAGARASLARLVRAHPKARLPADLRALQPASDPWSP